MSDNATLLPAEIALLAADPIALEILIGYHDTQEAQADAMDYIESAEWHRCRRAHLKEVQRAAIAAFESQGRSLGVSITRD